MTDNNKNTGNKKGFNAYWIYAIIVVFLIAYSLFQIKPQTIEIDNDKFFQLAENGLIEKVDLIKNEERAEIYLKQDQIDVVRAMDSIAYKTLKKKTDGIANQTPDLAFTTPPMSSFYDHLRNTKDTLVANKGPKFDFTIKYDDRTDVLGSVLSWLLFPAILIIFGSL